MPKAVFPGRKKGRRDPVLSLALLIAAAATAATTANCLTGGGFLAARNVKVVLSNAVYPSFIAWGLCFLFACGYTDMSLGGVVILGSFAACACGNAFGYPGVLLGGVITGVLLVFLNFMIFALTRIPSWIASVSLALIYEAAALVLRSSPVTRPYVDTELKLRAIGQFPWNLAALVLGLIAVYFVYNRTSVGLNVRAIGGNRDVARAMGVPVRRTLLWVGLICGLLLGVAATLQESYNRKTYAMSGLTSIQLIFKPLAIALLAQVLQKRINIILAVPICAILIYAVFNLMTFFGVPSGTLQDVFLGAFVIVFGVIGQRGVREVVK